MPTLKQASAQIVAAGKFLDAKRLAPATSGNYSMRLLDGTLAITVSGTHKGRLQEADIMNIDSSGKPLENKKPSAETLLHTQIYSLYPEANAILHAHSVAGTVLTRLDPAGEVTFEGYEMLKIFPGIMTHETAITVPVFDNSQDMEALSRDVARGIRKDVPAYLIRDHGFYVWGRDMAEAEHLAEALEYLLNCEIETLKIKAGASK